MDDPENPCQVIAELVVRQARERAEGCGDSIAAAVEAKLERHYPGADFFLANDQS
jgi:hypothetical protein